MRLGLLRDSEFSKFFAAVGISQIGTRITALALPLVAIISLRADPFEVGVVAACSTAGFLLVGLPAGVWVDRMSRHRVLVLAIAGRAAVLATVPVAHWLGLLTIWWLYLTALMLGVLTVFFDVASQSYLPHLVGRESLVEGNTRLESIRSVAHLGGPAVGGQLILVLTAPTTLLVDVTALVLAVALVWSIRKREPVAARQPGARLLPEIAEGLRFVIGHRLLRPIALCTSTFNFFYAAYTAMLLLFLQRVVGADAGTIGLVLTLTGVGGLAATLVARRIADQFGTGPTIVLAAALGAPCGLLMPLLAAPGPRLWVAALGGAALAAGIVIYNITQISLRQAATPDHLLGRMNATMRFLVWGPMPLGALLGGLIAEQAGVRNALLIAAAGLCLAFLPVLLSPLRTLRTVPEAEPVEP